MILRFLHGWGFDAGFWASLAGELAEWRVIADDRGYFGAPESPEAAGPCIVVAHSFGAMRTLSAPPPDCRGLIAINGFDRFVPGVSQRIVDRMIARFDTAPAAVLGDFRKRCGDDRPFGDIDAAVLREDLLALRDMDCTGRSAAWSPPILSLQGAEDSLLPGPMRDGVFADAPLLQRMTHADGGHLLPIEHPAWCARAIRA